MTEKILYCDKNVWYRQICEKKKIGKQSGVKYYL